MASEIPLRGLRIEDDLYRKIVALGKMNERSFNKEATFILRQYVLEYEKQHGPIQQPAHGE
jgi:hypothetical protein